MKIFSAFCLFFLATTFVCAQNSSDSTKLINQEIGFNTVSLIKQVISNNPSATLSQLPYDIFYNIYYQDHIGLRVGLGYFNSHNETPIQGQEVPRTTDETMLNLRVGVSYNFVNTKRITFNCFGDFIMQNIKSETASTTTLQSFPNPILSVTSKSSDKQNSIGGQIGVGVKYNIIKHLSIYAEVPIVFLTQKATSSSETNQPGVTPDLPTSVKNSTTQIILPATIYLVLRF